MVVENTKSNQQLAQVIASMATEEMYVSQDFMQELLKVSKGEKTTEELRQEVIKKYAGTLWDYLSIECFLVLEP